jgi:hypothetical protein
MKKTKLKKIAMLLVGLVIGHSTIANAQASPALPVDPTIITTAVQAPFIAAITFSIGAIALLKVIGWIKSGLRK